jgi:hypothetical protein
MARDVPFEDRSRYLAKMPQLATYLERGLDALGYSREGEDGRL